MLRFTRTSVIAFDFQEALSFEGETGPYIQYAVVRARNILRKLGERGDKLPDFEKVMSREVFDRQLANEDFWQMLLEASAPRVSNGEGGRGRGAGALGSVRLSARASLQQLLPSSPHPE